MTRPFSREGGSVSVPVFRPTCINRAFRWGLKWLKAAELGNLPGSSFKVLSALLGHQAEGRGAISRHGVSRRSGMARSTVRDGVKLLLENGWVTETSLGLVIPLAISDELLVRAGGGRISPLRKELKVKAKSMSPHTPTASPRGAMPPVAVPPKTEKPKQDPLTADQEAVVAVLEGALCDRAGAIRASRATKLKPEKIKRLIEDLEDLHKAGVVKSVQKAAVWALQRGGWTVTGFMRQAGRMRGEQARKARPEPTPLSTMPVRGVDFKAERARVLRAAVLALTPAQRVLVAGQVRAKVSATPVEIATDPWFRPRLVAGAWWDILLGDLGSRRGRAQALRACR